MLMNHNQNLSPLASELTNLSEIGIKRADDIEQVKDNTRKHFLKYIMFSSV